MGLLRGAGIISWKFTLSFRLEPNDNNLDRPAMGFEAVNYGLGSQIHIP